MINSFRTSLATNRTSGQIGYKKIRITQQIVIFAEQTNYFHDAIRIFRQARQIMFIPPVSVSFNYNPAGKCTWIKVSRIQTY